MKNKEYKKLVTDLVGAIPCLAVYCALRDRAKILSENRNKAGVYCIIHKRSGKRYVGSSVNLANRLRYYLSITPNTILPVARSAIYRSIKKHGLGEFLIVILERCEPKDCLVREQHYIDLLVHVGKNYNLTPKAGSWLGFKHSPTTIAKFKSRKCSEATRAKLRAILLGRKYSEATLAKMRNRRHSEATRAKIGVASLGRKHSDATLAKLRGRKVSEASLAKWRSRKLSENTLAKLRGREVGEETRAKLSAALKGRKLSEETKAKISAVRKGKKHSEETLAKLRGRKHSEETLAKLRGRKLSEETRTKMSETRLGKKHSEETRAKMKAVATGRAGTVVEVKNMETGETVEYVSIAKAAEVLGCDRGVITRRSESGALLRNIYSIKVKEMKAAATGRAGTLVEVKNMERGETVEYASIAKAAEVLGCDRRVITRCSESGALLRNIYSIKVKGQS